MTFSHCQPAPNLITQGCRAIRPHSALPRAGVALPFASVFRRAYLFLALLIAPCLDLGAKPETHPPPLEKVVLQLKWWHQFQFAGYYAAVEKGFYRDVGLDVELREATPPSPNIARIVTSGEAHFGVSSTDLLVQRAKGEPVVLLATIFQHSPLVLIARTDKTAIDPASLAKHEIMMEKEDSELLAFFHSAGIPSEQLKIRPHSRDMGDLIKGEVAVMSAYVANWIPSHTEMISVALVSPRSAGVDFPGDCLFTSEREIQMNPERVRLFREASIKGWEYALANPDEIIALILKKYSSRRTHEDLLFEAHQIRRHIHPELIPLGSTNAQRWQEVRDGLRSSGVLTDLNIDPLKGFLYEGFLERNPHVLYWLSGTAGVVILATFVWGIPLIRLNRRLQREIVERSQAEESASAALQAARDAVEARSHFIATVTHEIRTPLSIIAGYAKVLREQPFTPEEKASAIEAIHESSGHLLALVENILDLSKFEAQGVELLSGPFDLTLLLHGLDTIFGDVCRQKGVAFHLVSPMDGPLWVCGDEAKLRRVLFNLLGNAVKFTNRGKISLHVTMLMEPGVYLFEVIDNGFGIDSSDLPFIFEPFRQTAEGVERGGSGLGLPISLHLVELMGGTIDVQSIKGKGSRFSFSLLLPLAESASPSPAPSAPLPLQCHTIKALVVDDVEMNRVILAHLLRPLSVAVQPVSSGEEAIALSQREAFDIAFIDMRMQTIDGFETARRLRSLQPRMRLVCFSAASMRETAGNEQAGIFDAFLGKPFRAEEVKRCLDGLRVFDAPETKQTL